jgi:hypothetical protein
VFLVDGRAQLIQEKNPLVMDIGIAKREFEKILDSEGEGSRT